MKLVFHPRRMDGPLTVEKTGSVLVLNGQALDLAEAVEAAPDALPSPWLAGPVTRRGRAGYVVPLVLPHGADAPAETRFPAPLTLRRDGPVALPPFSAAETEKGRAPADPPPSFRSRRAPA